MDRIFKSADILLPKDCDMNKWSVVACDQFSSQPEYWEKLSKQVGDAPSSLYLMLPEAFLAERDQFEEAKRINATMDNYLDSGVFGEVKDSYVYVERTLNSGAVRRGIVGVLDLDAYDYSATSGSPVRATEGTVVDRLPPRVRVRQGAALEMPHIMVFIDDREDRVIGSLTSKRESLSKLYDFELSMNGGHIRGFQVSGENAKALDETVDELSLKATKPQGLGGKAPVIFAMGDGNHSLATAKKCWEEIKPALSDEEKANHPARFGMVELVNIHDAAISFEPIHKVIFGTKAEGFASAAEKFWSEQSGGADTSHQIRLIAGNDKKIVTVKGLTIGQLIGRAEEFCQSYMKEHGGSVDYIHNDDTAAEMGGRGGCAAILLPRMEKDELFPSIISSGPFPKKSFSIGHAEDKRYYLECRRIK